MKRNSILKLSSWALLALLNCYFPHLNAQRVEVDVGVILASDVAKQFKESIDGTSCLDIDKYAYEGSTRVYAEALLICQALTLGGITHLMFSTAWLSQKHDSLYVSEPLMFVGDFEKGIYTLAENKDLLNVRSLKQLQGFKAISNNQFLVDWQMLSQLGIDTYSHPNWDLVFKMLEAKRGDFILAEFSPEPDMNITTAGVKLIPVQNIKINFNDSRHVFVNKSQDNSAMIFAALQSGLKTLNQQGTIKKAYQSLGFYNEKITGWLSLGSQVKK
jgi:hypothetical protein